MIQTSGLKTGKKYLKEFIKLLESRKEIKWLSKWHNESRHWYLNCPASFAIRVTSTYADGVKFAVMYLWGLDINGIIFHGRTWHEYVDLIDDITVLLRLDNEHQLIVYVHDLAYAFQFLRPYFPWNNVFAREIRKPITADAGPVLYKCSLFLSGYKLSVLAKNLTEHFIRRIDDSYDYDLIRHPETDLTAEEMACFDTDLQIVEYFIAEEIKRNGSVIRIPLTQTGYVRRFLKDLCFPKNSKKEARAYRRYMQGLQVTENEYKLWKQAYTGGYTHANIHNAFKVHAGCRSQDFTSSYPAVLLAEQYPVSSGTPRVIKDKETFQKCINRYCCIFQAAFKNIKLKTCIDTPIPYNKCRNIIQPMLDNGRVMSADYLEITITEVDLEIIQSFYTYDEFLVGPMYTYHKGYLPKPILEGVLQLYERKTKLKHVEGKEAEYLHNKEMLNSCYGAAVTDIVPPVIEYDGEDWLESSADVPEELDKYNKNRTRFLYYPWGLYCTAYARRNLFSGVFGVGTNYIYSDTDSLKYIDGPEAQQYFKDFNAFTHYKNERTAKYMDTDPERFRPCDQNGCPHEIGLWDDEGAISRFKTIGAKRYLAETEDGLAMTVAGVRKEKEGGEFNGLDFLLKMSGDPFDNFDSDLVIPPGYSGKKIMTYCDFEAAHIITDYQGNRRECKEKMFVHTEEGSYSMDIADEYLEVFQELVMKFQHSKGVSKFWNRG